MKIIIAKNAGFCYGVKRALKKAQKLKSKYPDKKIYTFGPLIHNTHNIIHNNIAHLTYSL